MLNYIFYKKGKVVLFVTCSFFVSSVGTVCFASVPDVLQHRGYGPEEYQLICEFFGRGYEWGAVIQEMCARGYHQVATDLMERYKACSNSPWIPEEDQLLERLCGQFGEEWYVITRKMAEAGYYRNPFQCNDRWAHHKRTESGHRRRW
jgi:hypothetical protein